MSRRSWARERARLFRAGSAAATATAGTAAPGGEATRLVTRLVGRDFAPVPTRVRRPLRPVVPLVIGTVIAALLLVTLRVEILRLRYAVAEAAREEERLLERERHMTVRVQELRDPARLRSLAQARGFTRPRSVLTLRLPAEDAQ